VEPVFQRMEDWSGQTSHFRGTGGPLSVRDISDDAHPLCETYLKAAEQCQIPFNPDYNAASMMGAALYQINTRNGLRASSAACYLRPAMHRHNLHVETRAQVSRINFENKIATGVSYEKKGKPYNVSVRKEVIVCGGAINSPQLLQLSGVGPQDLLERYGIPLVHASSDVGQHLSDHLGADFICRTSVDTLNQQLRPLLGKLKVGLQFLLTRTGPLTLSLNQAGGFVSTTRSSAIPDLQLYFSPVSYTRAPVGTRPLINPDPFPGFLIGYNPCKPTSKGYLEICSTDARQAPRLQPNYLDTQHDKNLMLAGMRLMRKLTAAPALKDVINEEILPGTEYESDEQLMSYVYSNAWTVFHQCGTCRMGDNAKTAVVDARLKATQMLRQSWLVNGQQNLYYKTIVIDS